MAKYLPERIFPLRLAYLGQQLTGTIGLDRMPRLMGDFNQGSSARQKGNARVHLRFEHTEESPPRVSGEVGVCLTFECQRCLESVDIEVEATLNLVLVHEGQVSHLGTDEDYLELSEESVNLATLVEDELILALPIIALHPEGACTPVESISRVNEEPNESPFAVLSDLKRHL